MIKTKICSKCGKEKPIDRYVKQKQIKSGYLNSCKECENTIRNKNPEDKKRRNKKYRENNMEEIKSKAEDYRNMPKNKEKKKSYMRDWKLMNAYGLTPQDWDDMYISQGGSCAICGTHQSNLKKRLHVDHCHDTGKVRGLLCMSCNNGIGSMKDNIEILANAIKYLE